MKRLKMAGWFGAAALMCSGCIIEDEPESGEGSKLDMAADQGMDPDDGPPERDARVERDSQPPVPDMQRRDTGVPVDRGAGPGDVIFDTLIIFDDGSMDDGAGTSGADFCGVSADCAEPVSATIILGGGTLCEAEGPGCSTSRTDPVAILDDGSSCDPASMPTDFVSLGTDGQIAVGFDGDLRNCVVTVVEFAGATPEAWEAYICDQEDVGFAVCLNNDQPVATAPNGGEVTFAVPGQ